MSFSFISFTCYQSLGSKWLQIRPNATKIPTPNKEASSRGYKEKKSCKRSSEIRRRRAEEVKKEKKEKRRREEEKECRGSFCPHAILLYADPSSAYNAAKGRASSQVLDQVFHAAKMATQELLLLRRGQRHDPVAVGTLAAASTVCAKCAGKLRGAALKDRPALVGARARGRLRHEIEVEELDQLELDLAGGGPRLEEGCDRQEAVEAFKGARVVGRVDEGDDEGQESRRLDRRAVVGLEKIE